MQHGAGQLLLAAEDLAVSRERPRRAGLRGGFRPIPPEPVQSGITAQVRAGEALTITGPNGSGKSTFALTLAGLLAPVSGRVSATLELSAGAGIDPYRWKAQQLIARIGTVFQEPEHQFVTGRVLDELMFGPRHLGRGEERVDELLERLRLTELVDANPYTLSGGEKRRLSVATVLAAHPQVLVLDEPTFGQDANTWAELASFLSELLDGGTAVVSVTHDAEFSEVLGGTELSLRARSRSRPRTPGRDDREGRRAMRQELTLRGNHALLTRANPLAKFAAVMLITMVLALSIDWVSASVALAFELALLPLAGLTLGLLWQRGWPLILAAALGGWSTTILAPDSGNILLDARIWSISEGSLELGLGFMIRGLAIALPAVLLMSCTDPTDLADALAQKAKLPHRFVLGHAGRDAARGADGRGMADHRHGTPRPRRGLPRESAAAAPRHPGAELRAAGAGRPARLPARGHHGGPRLRRRTTDLGPDLGLQRPGRLGVAGRAADRRRRRRLGAGGRDLEHGLPRHSSSRRLIARARVLL